MPTFTFQDLIKQLEETRQQGYGCAFVVFPWEDNGEIVWSMCGSGYVDQGILQRDYPEATAIASRPIESKDNHEVALEWLGRIRSALGVNGWNQMFIPQRGGQVLNENAKKKALSA